MEECRVERNQRGGKSWRSRGWRRRGGQELEEWRMEGKESGKVEREEEGKGGKSRKGERDKEYVTFIREEGM